MSTDKLHINNNKEIAEMLPIERTALVTVADLVLDTNITGMNQVLDRLIDYVPNFIPNKSGFGYLAESRYKTSEQIIQNGRYKQVVELGSGFTIHAYSLRKVVPNYIEVEHSQNSTLKQRIVHEVYSDLNNANYVAGDAFNDDLWNDIATKLTIAPVAIFAEGFMQYTSKAERDRLFKNVREILTKCGGCFFFEDSLTFHPEIYDHDSGSSTQAISKKMQSISKNSNLTKYISQESLTAELESYGFDIERASPVKDLESESFDNAGSEILNIFKHWKLTIRK